MKIARPDAIVMHPGPMNRGIEIEGAWPTARGRSSRSRSPMALRSAWPCSIASAKPWRHGDDGGATSPAQLATRFSLRTVSCWRLTSLPAISSSCAFAHPSALRPRARQFRACHCDDSLPMRRPLSIMRVGDDWIEMLYKIVGDGLRLLAQKQPGDESVCSARSASRSGCQPSARIRS